MNKRLLHSLQLILVTLDILTINSVYVITGFLFQKQLLLKPGIEYIYLLIFFNIAWLIVSFINNVYHEHNLVSFESFSKASLKSYLYFLLAILFYLFFIWPSLISSSFIPVVLSFIFAALFLKLLLYFVIYYPVKNRNWLVSKVIVVGYNSLSKKLVDYLTQEEINKQIVGFCEEEENVHEWSNYPILSSIKDAVNVCKKYGATEIYSTITPEQNPDLYGLIESAENNCIRFKIVPDLGIFVKQQMYIQHLNEIPVISVRKEPLEKWGNQLIKRAFDIMVSLFVLAFILSWLIPLVSLFILLESRGPVFFTQLRTGKNKKNFKCLKFRSMKMSNTAHLQQATKEDERITSIGKFLRRTSLDEFPQFLNVLRGDMSIVGPRPHMLKHTDEYSKLIGKYMVRQLLKPGITGWAQVNGFRGETKHVSQMQKRVEHDLWYLENWSLLLDIKIIGMTALNIMKGEKNAY